MIVFTRLNRTEIGLNPDQIQRPRPARHEDR